MKRRILKYFGSLRRPISAVREWWRCSVAVRNPSFWGRCSEKVLLATPLYVSRPDLVFFEDYTRLQAEARFIIDRGRVTIKRYTAVGARCTIITGNHRPTVGVPHFLLGLSHINDQEGDVTLEEDVWVGAGVTILSGVVVSRGSIVAAGAVVNKSTPPYALVAGVPAKIVAVKFSLEQILEHEKMLYEPHDRLSKEYLEELFARYYLDKWACGTSHIGAEDAQRLKEVRARWGV